MKRICLFIIITLSMIACRQESLVDRAAREAKEYTERMCPTPVYNETRTDSVTFDKISRTYTYHCSFLNYLDDSAAIANIKEKLHQQLLEALIENTGIKAYKEDIVIRTILCSRFGRTMWKLMLMPGIIPA